MSFAVVDFETTGILPSYHHRVVEIGVTHVEDDGAISLRWETLINPERDLGPQRIHGIRAADVLDAPTFSDVAAEFAELLQGRVFAAHNASFDLRFLQAEFERAGYWLDGETPHVCTMTLGSRFGLGQSCSLSRACTTYGIDIGHAHCAGADSFAAARLLAAFHAESNTRPEWVDYWQRAAESGRAYSYPTGRRTGVAVKARSDAGAAPVSFLERISMDAERPRVEGAGAQYVALLDRCLIDGLISVSEGAQLAEVASELGLNCDAVDEIHRDYFVELERRAWADGVLAEDERATLRAVGALLELDDEAVAEAVDDIVPTAGDSQPESRFKLSPGDIVVLTGEMLRERSAWEADLRELGLVPHPSVTKKVKLVVAADPDSLSGKAKKARDYGIPIVGESWLADVVFPRQNKEVR